MLAALLRRRSNRRLMRLEGSTSIAESGFVVIGGIDQWVSVRGEDRANPILLLVHGGPGSPYSIFSPLLRGWEKHFTVVQWDQRGAGKTWRRSGKAGPLSFDRLASDGLELVEHLTRRLQQPKVILVGSSVGSITGLLMAKRRPELFSAYVGVDQNVGADPGAVGLQMTLQKVLEGGQPRVAERLQAMGPVAASWSRADFDFRNHALMGVVREVPHMIKDVLLPSLLSSPDHGFFDVIDVFRGMGWSSDQLVAELLQFDARALGLRYELPFFIFQGDADVITPTASARRFFDEVEAPRKAFALIERAGHLAAFARPAQFLSLLLQHTRATTGTHEPADAPATVA